MGGMGETEVQAGREGWYIHFMVQQKLTQNYKAIIFQFKKKSQKMYNASERGGRRNKQMMSIYEKGHQNPKLEWPHLVHVHPMKKT